jgi:hypothetical protein
MNVAPDVRHLRQSKAKLDWRDCGPRLHNRPASLTYGLIVSQYPPPDGPTFDYARPSQPPDAAHPLLAPARRAAILMFVLGGLTAAFGLCFGAVGWVIPANMLVGASGLDPSQLDKIESSGMPVSSFLHLVFTCAGVMALVVGVLLLVLGVKVRRGRRGATVGAMVVCGLVTLYLLVNFAMVSGRFISQPDAGFVVNVALAVIVIAAFGLLLTWLYQALQASSKIRSLQSYNQGQFFPGAVPHSPAVITPGAFSPGAPPPLAPNSAGVPGGATFPTPPSGQPPVRFGYAQPPVPTIPPPPPGDAPVSPAPPASVPIAPRPGPESGGADQSSDAPSSTP